MAVIEVELVTGWEAYNPDYLLNEVVYNTLKNYLRGLYFGPKTTPPSERTLIARPPHYISIFTPNASFSPLFPLILYFIDDLLSIFPLFFLIFLCPLLIIPFLVIFCVYRRIWAENYSPRGEGGAGNFQYICRLLIILS
jgi:hypothetical protein